MKKLGVYDPAMCCSTGVCGVDVDPAVVKEMEAGMERLPIIAIDSQIVTTGLYPSRAQLAQKLGLALATADKPHVRAGSCCNPKSGCC